MKATPKGWPRLSTAIYYDDAVGAIDWLCRALGFEVRLKVEGDSGRIGHCRGLRFQQFNKCSTWDGMGSLVTR